MSDPPVPPPVVAENAAVAASVAVRLPDFWKNDPVMWFAQAEAQFELANVVRDHTKYNHIVAKIDQTVICHVADIITNPPENDKYRAVKERLISRFTVSPQARLERLMNACDLGDMRPTHLLAKMQELSAGLKMTDDLLKMLFLQRLPPDVKNILTISDEKVGKLAEMADKMMDAPTRHVSAASSSSTMKPEDSDLRCQIAALTEEIRNLKADRGRSTSRSRSASRSSSRNTYGDGDEICWFHRKYGGRALKCRDPCKFRNQKN